MVDLPTLVCLTSTALRLCGEWANYFGHQESLPQTTFAFGYLCVTVVSLWYLYYTTEFVVCQGGFEKFFKNFSMVFYTRQYRELNPSHHVGPDATSHRPLTFNIIPQNTSFVNSFFGKICE